ncbi:ArsR/SmtB family transcription factor [Georgenia sp. Z1491]|uniref:ArsR/SmtB family transcription factor n=1 Tax=Georgenia sp. Z1491 TaxID=3416707 RepID=UPI003CE7FE30
MTSTNNERIHDPERIRGMAHPLRLELLDVLHELGEATATECARRVDESVASCSFHLRTLEKYGYVERAEPRGREKPWRAVHRSLSTAASPDVPGSLHATTELATMNLRRRISQFAAVIERLPHEPDEWVDATSLSTADVWLTAAETVELRTQLMALIDRYEERTTDPATRPAGARRVHLTTTIHSDPPRETS